MPGNSFGQIFTLSTFGESHGKAIGGIIDGCPAGLRIDESFIQHQLDRRRPGQSDISTQRKEKDRVELLSGIFEGKTLGTPIGFIIRNKDQRPADYDSLKDKFRPSHADLTYALKYGHRDHRGGGRASARETACRVVGGSIAMQLLALNGIAIRAWVSQVGSVKTPENFIPEDHEDIDSNPVRCPHRETADAMIAAIKHLATDGDTLGGEITCLIQHYPPGVGEPVFDKLEADLAKAMLSINAAKGFEIGLGFKGISMPGSLYRDHFVFENGEIKTKTNHDGGINGGISNGMDILFRVAFKPVSTSRYEPDVMDKQGHESRMEKAGRHDPCVVPRAVPIVESMAALVLADHWLRMRTSKI